MKSLLLLFCLALFGVSCNSSKKHGEIGWCEMGIEVVE